MATMRQLHFAPAAGGARSSGAARAPEGARRFAEAMLRDHMTRLCAEAASVGVADHDGVDPGRSAALVARVQTLAASALESLDVVTVLFGEVESRSPELDDAPPVTLRSGASPGEPHDLSDAVALARSELRSRMRDLHGLGGSADAWERLSVAGRALRGIQSTLGDVHRAMTDVEQARPSMDFYGQPLERALQIRRRYVHLHTLVTGLGAPRRDDLRDRLRQIGNAISHLLGLDLAVHVRAGDRALLLLSRTRLRDWLAGPGEGAAHSEVGLRLWQDVANATTLLLDVNRREELVQHDLRLAREALRDLPSIEASPGESARLALFRRLSALLGRTPGLDALLATHRATSGLANLREVLLDLERTLTGQSADDEVPPSGRRPIPW